MKRVSVLLLAGLLWGGPAFAAYHFPVCPNRNNPNVPNDPPCQVGFPVALTELGNDSVSASSPTIIDLDGDGTPEIVFGTQGGRVVAVHADGSLYWQYKTGNVAVNSKPAVADLKGDGKLEVVVGAGDGGATGGGVYVLSSTGQLQCSFTTLNPVHQQGMYSSPALGHLDPSRPTKMQIAIGSFDFRIRALNDDCSIYWEKGQAESVVDTVWSSPALVDLDGDGQLDVVIGQDSNAQTNNGLTVPNGGVIRAFRGNGLGELPGFPIMLNEVIYSSPAVGDITGSGRPQFVVGNGRCWDVISCSTHNPHAVQEAVFAYDRTGAALTGWPAPTPVQSSRAASPALADLNGDGHLETVINTMVKAQVYPNVTNPTLDKDGWVHVLQTNGSEMPGWPKQPNIPNSCTAGDYRHDGTQASPILADLNGDGVSEIILPAANEFVIWDKVGNQLTSSNGCPAEAGKWTLFTSNVGAGLINQGVFGAAAAADLDHDGHIEIVGLGTTTGVPNFSGTYVTVYAWTFPNSKANASDSMPWPAFRHDVRNTGVFLPDRIFKNGFD